jgi:hypothetical protein
VEENNHPQTADAGKDQIAQASGTVTLDGTPSSDPDDDKLTYKWTQINNHGGNVLSVTLSSLSPSSFFLIITYSVILYGFKLCTCSTHIIYFRAREG